MNEITQSRTSQSEYNASRISDVTMGAKKMADFFQRAYTNLKTVPTKKIMTLGKLFERSFIWVISEISCSSGLGIRASHSKMPHFQTSPLLNFGQKRKIAKIFRLLKMIVDSIQF